MSLTLRGSKDKPKKMGSGFGLKAKASADLTVKKGKDKEGAK